MQFILHCSETNQLFAANKVFCTSYKFIYRDPLNARKWDFNALFNSMCTV